MAQEVPQLCPRCGNALLMNQRFCARCGLDMASLSSLPPQPLPSAPSAFPAPPLSQPGFQPLAHLPIPPQTPSPFSQSQAAPQQQYMPPQQSFAQNYVSPGVALPAEPDTAPIAATTPRKRRIGRAFLPLALLLLIVLAIVGYFGAAMLGIHIGSAAQPTITSTGIQLTATYADVDVTLQKVQQAQSFNDDPDVGSDGAIRLFLLAQNKATVPVNLPYNTMTHIVLPGGKAVEPSYIRASIGVPPGASKTGLLDFAVPADTNVSQLTLRLGGADDAPIDIPLRAGADLSSYAPRTTPLSGAWQYLGLDWSLASATTQLSMDGKQAARNMRYVTITLKVDNTLAQTAISGSPYDYILLKAGNDTLRPIEATLPVSFAAGVHGQSGTITFLIPQNTPALTLIMVPQKQGGFDQASHNFQL